MSYRTCACFQATWYQELITTSAVLTEENKLTAAQLANQVWLQMREEVSAYYDSMVTHEDETTQAQVHTRNVSLQAQVLFLLQLAPGRCVIKLSKHKTL